MKIWHDNSGKGSKASWFLKHILVRDLQTNEKFYFYCQKWLALEKSDGKIERELFVASESEKKFIRYLMKKEANDCIRDHHLWLSVFYRPTRSIFTRLDRITCCFVFHYFSMLLNILYYDQNMRLIGLTIFNIKLQQVKKTCKVYLKYKMYD